MKRGNPKNIFEEGKRYLTGTKNPQNKRLIYAIIIVLFISVFGLFINYFFGKGMDKLDEKVGIETFPQEINYICTGFGITKTITIRNYDDKPIENFALTISWPKNQSLNSELKEIGSNSLRGEIQSIVLGTSNEDGFTHQVYPLVNIKPNAILEFDLKLSADCYNDFYVYINKFQPLLLVERI